MNRPLALLAVLLATTTGAAIAQSPGQTGALPTPANLVVGVWKVDVAVGPCSLPNPVAFFSAYSTFHAGGTLSDTNWAPPATRGPGQGVWEYLGNGQYASRFQFFRYDQPGPASGIQDVRVQVTLDAGGDGYTGVVNGQQLALDGTPVGPPLCGEAVGSRIGLQ